MKSLGLIFTMSLVLGVSIGFGYATPLDQEEKQESKQEEKKESEEPKQEEKESSETEAKEEVIAPDEFPVVDNMHHFMEYITEPTYKRLKAAMETEPESRNDWKEVKGYAMILAETSVLVADRPPRDSTEEQIQEWRNISWEVRESARVLYRSMGRYKQAREKYELLIDSCNKCHNVFEDGRHQLEK